MALLSCGCTSKKDTNPLPIKTDKITKFELYDSSTKFKEVKDKNDIKAIEDLINTVKTKDKCKDDIMGIGCGVHITYSNGKSINLSFLSTTVFYFNDGSSSRYYIDKDIVQKLQNYYDKL